MASQRDMNLSVAGIEVTIQTDEDRGYMLKLASMVDEVRNAVLFGICPDWGTFAWNMGLAFIICRLGLCWFLKTKKGFADVL
mgnify:CR=1 FL=1